MKKNLLKMFAILALFAASLTSLTAQVTMPLPFDLSSGNYSLNAWASTEPAATYPASMMFHRAGNADPLLAVEMATDYNLAYSLTSGTRVNGLGADGFRFINTSSPGNLGAAVLALNTTNRNTIKVSWNSAIVLQGDRLYGLRLQYQIGTTGGFQDLLDASGNPYEVLADRYSSTMGQTGAVWTFPSITLPSSVENQPVVYLRWKYYYVSGAGSRPSISVDDISVTSESSIGTPTKFKISKVVPAVPSSNFPFSIRVSTTNDAGIPKFVSAATTVKLNFISGTGTLLGETLAVVPANSYEATFTNLKYNKTTDLTVSVSANEVLPLPITPDTTTISFVEGPSALVFNNLLLKTHKNFLLPSFTAEAVDEMGNPLATYQNINATLTATGPGNLVGTNVRNFIQGVATFDDITFDAPGTYTLILSAPGFTTTTTAQVFVADAISEVELLTPKYFKGNNSLGSDPYGPRVPAFALVELNNLLPNTTYRYYTGGTNWAPYDVTPLSNNASGVNIHADYNNNTYSYNSSRNFGVDGQYSFFTTGPSQTSKKVWVNLIGTNGSTFRPGDTLYWLLTLGFEDGRFITRFKGTKISMMLDFGNDPVSATGIYDEKSQLEPKTFLAFFDDTNSDPLSVAVVQSIDAPLQTPGYPPQSPWWFADYESTTSAWATILPNDLSTGVRRIAQYNANGDIIRQWVDADGVWAGVNTVNPLGGRVDPIHFQTPQLTLLTPSTNEELCNNDEYYISWNSHGVDNINIEISFNNGSTYETLFENVPARKGYMMWDIPRHLYSERAFTLRISSVEHSYISSLSNSNYIWDNPMQVNVTSSTILCQTENLMLSIIADGSDLHYQWYKDNKMIAGANLSSYDLNNVKYLTSGSYYCMVTGKASCPVLKSDMIEVYVATPTEISKQPDAQNVIEGGVAKFYAEAHIVGQRPDGIVTMQWYKGTTMLVDNDRIAGAKSNFLTIKGVMTQDEATDYYIVFNGLCPNSRVESRRVSLKLVDLMFTLEPVAQVSCENTDITFTATAETATGQTISYQWYKGNTQLSDNSTISGANTNTLTVFMINPSNAGDYRCMAEIASLGLKVWSAYANLNVDKAPIARIQPEANIIVEQSKTIDIEFDVESASSTTYQWFKDGTVITGATSKMFSKDNALASDEGEYYCVATNACGELTSEKAYVTITVKGFTGVNDEVVAGMFSLMTVNPNPVSTIANISFVAPMSESVTLTLSDALGNEIAQIFAGTAQYGVNTVSYNASNLTSGIYFITMKSLKSVSTQRLVVVK